MSCIRNITEKNRITDTERQGIPDTKRFPVFRYDGGRLLRDPTSKGLHRLNYTKSLGVNRKWKLKPEHEWVSLPVPPILSKELWHDCNAILDEQERKRKPAKKAVHLFTGYVSVRAGKDACPSRYSLLHLLQMRVIKSALTDLETIFQEQLKALSFPRRNEEYPHANRCLNQERKSY